MTERTFDATRPVGSRVAFGRATKTSRRGVVGLLAAFSITAVASGTLALGAGNTVRSVIERVSPAQVPPGGVSLGIALADQGNTPLERLRHLLANGSVPAGKSLVLVGRGPELSSPDTIVVNSAAWNGRDLAVEVAMRRFDGTLHMNVVTVPLVQTSLGPLAPGDYQVVVNETTEWFTDLAHPDRTARSERSATRLAFTVR